LDAQPEATQSLGCTNDVQTLRLLAACRHERTRPTS